MALFTDGPINSLLDLERYESGLLAVSSIEQIDLAAKMALAQDQIGADILLYLIQKIPRDPRYLLGGHESASIRRIKGVSDVVVTDQLKQWHALLSIAMMYEDAFNSQLNDRYQKKWQRYKDRVEEASRQYYRVGIGLSLNPVAKPAEPLLAGVAGGALGSTYYVRIAWVNREGQEGAASDVVSLTTVDGMQLLIAASAAPQNAYGWNAYTGLAPEALSLQNDLPLAINTDWVLPSTGLKFGRKPSNGQSPDVFVVDRQVYQRG